MVGTCTVLTFHICSGTPEASLIFKHMRETLQPSTSVNPRCIVAFRPVGIFWDSGDLSHPTSGRHNNSKEGGLCQQSILVPTWLKNAPPGLDLENTWVQKIRDEYDGRVVPNQIDCWAEKYLIELTVFTFLCHRRRRAAAAWLSAQ